MARLDKLLMAILVNKMNDLVLEPEQLPRMRGPSGEREFTKSKLSSTLIRQLLIEVTPSGTLPDKIEGDSWVFNYQLEGRVYQFRNTISQEGWRSVVAPIPDQAPLDEIRQEMVAEREQAEDTATETATGDEATPLQGGGEHSTLRVDSIRDLLEIVLREEASDLHISADQTPRIRVHGSLTQIQGIGPLSAGRVRDLIFEVTPQRNREEFERRNDTDFAYEIPGQGRFRVNVFHDHHGVGGVFRQIPEQIPTFEQLGLPEVLRSLVHLSKGLVLVTGPTGSGKSTSLAAIINLINQQREDHIITVEDPIEFVHPSKKCLVNQREVGVHTSSFKDALRAALREDPDIILVGELRDLETVSIAIETAETGHLVFGTLHTTTAPSTVERVIDQFPADQQSQIRMMLAESLRAVVAQTLLKKIGGGRVAAFEVLLGNPAVANLIREGKTFQIASAMQTGKQQGMIMMNDALMELVSKKLVTPEEAYSKAVNQERLLKKFETADIRLDLDAVGS
ncbi:MAG: type IV pilus twitching motility protein PilT [Thermoanaerobaculia bacterium]